MHSYIIALVDMRGLQLLKNLVGMFNCIFQTKGYVSTTNKVEDQSEGAKS